MMRIRDNEVNHDGEKWMTRVLEVNEDGSLLIPAELLEGAEPQKRYAIERNNGTVTLRPLERVEPFWKTASPAELAQSNRECAATHKEGPGLPDEAHRRDSIHDD